MRLTLNIEKWNQKRIAVETDIRALKDILSQPGHMGTSKQWSDLRRLQREATILYMVRAETRGHLHCYKEVSYVPASLGTTLRSVKAVSRERQQERIQALLPTPLATPDENGQIGIWNVCAEAVAVPA